MLCVTRPRGKSFNYGGKTKNIDIEQKIIERKPRASSFKQYNYIKSHFNHNEEYLADYYSIEYVSSENDENDIFCIHQMSDDNISNINKTQISNKLTQISIADEKILYNNLISELDNKLNQITTSNDKRIRNNSLTELGNKLHQAQQNDDYNRYIKLYKRYKYEWRNAENNDQFIPPNFYVSKVIYDPGCNRIEVKLSHRIIRLQDGSYDLVSSIE